MFPWKSSRIKIEEKMIQSWMCNCLPAASKKVRKKKKLFQLDCNHTQMKKNSRSWYINSCQDVWEHKFRKANFSRAKNFSNQKLRKEKRNRIATYFCSAIIRKFNIVKSCLESTAPEMSWAERFSTIRRSLELYRETRLKGENYKRNRQQRTLLNIWTNIQQP